MVRNRVLLDDKDLKIVKALEKYGPKTTTKKMSKILVIPPRTLRYRLAKLRANGYLQPLGIFTHERRIGLGENIVILDISPRDKPFPKEFFERTPAIYWYSSTYGGMNGYIVNTLYPLDDPRAGDNVLELLKDAGLITRYMVFGVTTYTTKGWNFSWFDKKGNWTWKWSEWQKRIDAILTGGKRDVIFNIEDQPQIPFDASDIQLLRLLHENAKTTQNQLSVKLNLPISQIRRRIKRLEDEGIILGYKSMFTPFQDTLTLLCFIEAKSSIGQINSCLYELPYALDILIESASKECIRVNLSSTDIIGFFRGLDHLRHLADSLTIQIVHDDVSFGASRVFGLYNESENRWHVPGPEYVTWLEECLNAG